MNHRKPKHAKPRMLVFPDMVRQINANYSVVGENIAILENVGEDTGLLLQRIAEGEAELKNAMKYLLWQYNILQTRRHASAPMPDLMKEELDALQIRTEH